MKTLLAICIISFILVILGLLRIVRNMINADIRYKSNQIMDGVYTSKRMKNYDEIHLN